VRTPRPRLIAATFEQALGELRSIAALKRLRRLQRQQLLGAQSAVVGGLFMALLRARGWATVLLPMVHRQRGALVTPATPVYRLPRFNGGAAQDRLGMGFFLA